MGLVNKCPIQKIETIDNFYVENVTF